MVDDLTKNPKALSPFFTVSIVDRDKLFPTKTDALTSSIIPLTTFLKKHLNYCKENNIPVVIVGDLFCLMQGRGDNRRNKSDILPEHNNAFYLDSIVETAVEWFKPYADIIKVIGYGNHETGIIKYQETDVLKRFVDMMNIKYNSKIEPWGS